MESRVSFDVFPHMLVSSSSFPAEPLRNQIARSDTAGSKPMEEEEVTALSPLASNQDGSGMTVARNKAAERPSAGAKWYKQRFRDCWLLDERFKSWLLRVPDDPYRAKCKVCKAYLRAGKSELSKHAGTKLHQATLRAVEGGEALLGFANQAPASSTSDQPPLPESEESSQAPDDELWRAESVASVEPPAPPLAAARGRLPVLGVHPLVQCRAPDFNGLAVVDGEIRKVQLSDYEGKFLVLFFYPLDFSLAPPTELVEFSERAAEFRELNAGVLAVSTDSYCTHLAWTSTPRARGGLGGVNVPLLSDFTKKISRAYNVLVEDVGFALKAVFIIDARGMVRQVTVNDVCLRVSVAETLRLLKLLHYVEVRGAPIAASWAPEIDVFPEARTAECSVVPMCSANNV